MTITSTKPVESGALTPTVQAEAARAGFAAGITRPLAWRRAQLRALDRLLEANGPAIEEALLADLGKPPIESFLAETGSVRSEIKLVLKNLDRWTARRRAKVPIALQPATAMIIREPLGTVLVISPWNYPIHLLFMPVVAAIAAGNAVVIKPSELAPATSAVAAALVPSTSTSARSAWSRAGSTRRPSCSPCRGTTSSTPATAPSAGSSWRLRRST